MITRDIWDDARELLREDMTPEAAALLVGLESIAGAIRSAHPFPTDLAIGAPLKEIAESIGLLASTIEEIRR